MKLTPSEEIISNEACDYINSKKDELINIFILKHKPLRLGIITIFMAGSPGAGKTEFANRYMPKSIHHEKYLSTKDFLLKKGFDLSDVESLFIHIDVDEIRKFLPQYLKTDITTGTKANAHVVQKAAGKGLDILRNYCFENNISFLHDGTFGNYKTMREIVKKSIETGREVQIQYLYLDPLVAWEYTKARELEEGRNILPEKFIDQYFSSRKNVDDIKREFGDNVKVHCIFKNNQNEVDEILFNQSSIDSYLQSKYNKGTSKEYSQEELYQLIQ